MRVTTKDLRRALTVILDHLEEVGESEIDVDEDFYWDVPSSSRYDSYAQPQDLTVGQLSDDWSHVLAIARGEEEPIGYSAVWAAAILRAIGEKSVG